MLAALGSWLLARQAGGEWLVRIEDIDPPREVAGAAREQLRTLAAFGLRHDGEIALQGKVTQRSYPGGHYRYGVAVGEHEFMVRDTRVFEIGTPVSLCLPLGALHLFPNNETAKAN